MFHVKHPSILLISISFHSLLWSQVQVTIQDKPFVVPSQRLDTVVRFLSSQSDYSTQNTHEKEFFYWVNHMRSNPTGFARDVVSRYLEEFPEMKSESAIDLLNELNGLTTLPLLHPKAFIGVAAKKHALFLLQTNRNLTHTGSGGKDFFTRMKDAGIGGIAGENLYEGRGNLLEALIVLLIDHGVPSYGHRKTLLNPNFHSMGCSILAKAADGTILIVQIMSSQ